MAGYNPYPMNYGYNGQPYPFQQPQYPQPQPQFQQPQMQMPMQAQPQPQAQVQPQPQQVIQNGGFISVRDIGIAQNWPVAPGNSITFKDESAPYIYTKTMGYNQLESPKFEKFRLVKEDEAQPEQAVQEKPQMPQVAYLTKKDLGALETDVKVLKKRIGEVEKSLTKKEDELDDE